MEGHSSGENFRQSSSYCFFFFFVINLWINSLFRKQIICGVKDETCDREAKIKFSKSHTHKKNGICLAVVFAVRAMGREVRRLLEIKVSPRNIIIHESLACRSLVYGHSSAHSALVTANASASASASFIHIHVADKVVNPN